MEGNSFVKLEGKQLTFVEPYNERQIFTKWNKVSLVGRITEDFVFDHKSFKICFYKARMAIKRKSGVEDYVYIMVPEYLLLDDLKKNAKGKYIELAGQFRTYRDLRTGDKPKFYYFVLVMAMNIIDTDDVGEDGYTNVVYLRGEISKDTVFRITPFGREVTEMILKVNRRGNFIEVVPCIAWGRKAVEASKLKVGDKIELEGRIQSRKYFKRYSPDSDEGEYKEVYEISIWRFRKIED